MPGQLINIRQPILLLFEDGWVRISLTKGWVFLLEIPILSGYFPSLTGYFPSNWGGTFYNEHYTDHSWGIIIMNVIKIVLYIFIAISLFNNYIYFSTIFFISTSSSRTIFAWKQVGTDNIVMCCSICLWKVGPLNGLHAVVALL